MMEMGDLLMVKNPRTDEYCMIVMVDGCNMGLLTPSQYDQLWDGELSDDEQKQAIADMQAAGEVHNLLRGE